MMPVEDKRDKGQTSAVYRLVKILYCENLISPISRTNFTSSRRSIYFTSFPAGLLQTRLYRPVYRSLTFVASFWWSIMCRNPQRTEYHIRDNIPKYTTYFAWGLTFLCSRTCNLEARHFVCACSRLNSHFVKIRNTSLRYIWRERSLAMLINSSIVTKVIKPTRQFMHNIDYEARIVYQQDI